MKILVVGNGFDLAHNLPTSYLACLRFLGIAYSMGETRDFSYWQSRLWRDRSRMDKDLEILADEHISFLKKYLAFILELDHYLGDRQCDVFILHECIKRNLWLLHFEECQKRNHNIRRNWIDFESEISLVIQMMELTLKQAKESSLTTNELEENFFSGQDLKQYPYFKVLGSEIMSYIRRSFSESVSVDVAKSSLIDKLYEDLTRACLKKHGSCAKSTK